MWAALVPLLAKAGISLAITLLQKTGVISSFEADGIRAGTHVIQAIEQVQTTDEFPTGRNGQTEQVPLNVASTSYTPHA